MEIISNAKPPLIYDYYGFPDEAYNITYDLQGQPLLAEKIFQCLREQEIKCNKNDRRGFDHGVFVPLKIMYPDANIPCVQISLLKSLNAAQHVHVGKALSKLDWENLLIMGSGFSFHNLREFFTNNQQPSRENILFEQWLLDVCTNDAMKENQRLESLIQWEQAPHARFCHPREEHFLPLHVCYGVAQAPAVHSFTCQVGPVQTSALQWTVNS